MKKIHEWNKLDLCGLKANLEYYKSIRNKHIHSVQQAEQEIQRILDLIGKKISDGK